MAAGFHFRASNGSPPKNQGPRQLRNELESQDNLVPELAKLNYLLPPSLLLRWRKIDTDQRTDSAVYALRRESEEGKDIVLVLVTLTSSGRKHLFLTAGFWQGCLVSLVDLLGQKPAGNESFGRR